MGKYLAVDVGKETVIFEKVSLPKNDFKESRRVPGSLLCLYGVYTSFLMDGKQIITIIKKIGPEEDKEVGEELSRNEGKKENKEESKTSDVETESTEKDSQSNLLQVCFWDVLSGKCVEKLDVPIGNKTLLNVSTRRKEVIDSSLNRAPLDDARYYLRSLKRLDLGFCFLKHPMLLVISKLHSFQWLPRLD